MKFTIEGTDSKARAGRLETSHGCVETPFFMPVATQGSVKAVDPADLMEAGSQIILSNAYHLYLRPGDELISKMGGLHKFMGWDRPILTDSGGFQGFSLRDLREIYADGIKFRSHIDGSEHMITPQSIVKIQENLGSDIIMPLDVCLPTTSDKESLKVGLYKTSEWMQICLESKENDEQALFGIVQGGIYDDLREQSAEFMTSLDMPGYSIGGLSVGESKDDMYRIAGKTADLLPNEKPRYLMGVGSPEDLVENVANGIDMFDCVLPTRVARNGALFTKKGRVNVNTSRFRGVDCPIDKDCRCYTCLRFSTGYLHHLFKAREYLAYRLASIHNITFINNLTRNMRDAIMAGKFHEFYNAFMADYVPVSSS